MTQKLEPPNPLTEELEKLARMTQRLEQLVPVQMWTHCKACRELDDYCSPECERVIFAKEICIHGRPVLEPCAECSSRWSSEA